MYILAERTGNLKPAVITRELVSFSLPCGREKDALVILEELTGGLRAESQFSAQRDSLTPA